MNNTSKISWWEMDERAEEIDWSVLPLAPLEDIPSSLEEEVGSPNMEGSATTIAVKKDNKKKPKAKYVEKQYYGRVIARIRKPVKVYGRTKHYLFYLIDVKNAQWREVGAKRILAAANPFEKFKDEELLHWNRKDKSKRLRQGIHFSVRDAGDCYPYNEFGYIEAYNLEVV